MLFAIALLATSQSYQVGRQAVDPATYLSPSREWTLDVDPSRPDGAGGATYRVTHGADAAWTAELEVTFLDGGITDGGVAFGYALTEGRRRGGSLHVLVLAADGSVLLDQQETRCTASFMHGPPAPNVLAAHALHGADTLVLRISDADWSRRQEEWWSYRLSTGEVLPRFRPQEAFESEAGLQRIVYGSVMLAGPGLILLSGSGTERSPSRRAETWAALVQADGKPVWIWSAPEHFTRDGAGEEAPDEIDLIRNRGLARSGDRPDEFRLWLVGERQRATFRVQTEDDEWRIEEVARQPYDGEPESLQPYWEESDLRVIENVPLARAPTPEGIPLGPVSAWGFVGSELVSIRHVEGRVYEHLRLESSGAVSRRMTWDELPEEPRGSVAWTHLGGDRWLVTISPPGENARSAAFLADAADGSLAGLRGFRCPEVESVAVTPDGGFVILATHNLPFTLLPALIAFGPDGREAWRIEKGLLDSDAPDAFSIPVDVAILADGQVAVLDNGRDSILLFDSAGVFLRSIDLEDAWGAEPNYLTGIVDAPGSGFLVNDFHGGPPLRELNPDGTVRRAFDPVLANGHQEHKLRSGSRFAPDGSLWTTDGHRFYVLDEAGREVRALGAEHSMGRFNDRGPAAIDRLGRIVVQDSRTAALHVWGFDGGKLLVAVPDPSDFERISTIARITAGPDGGFAVHVDSGSDELVLFDVEGNRVEKREVARGAEFLFGSERSFRWGGKQQGVGLFDGEELAELVERLPTGRWATDPEDVFPFPDGSFVLLADGEIGFYGAEGEPRTSISLPWEGGGGMPFGPGPVVGPMFLHKVGATESWVLASGFESRAWLANRADGSLRLVSAEDLLLEPGSTCEWSLSPDGKEVWVLETSALVLHRCALP